MAGENETPFSYYAGVNLYAIVREPGGDVLNEGTDTFEAYSTGNRDQYGLTPTEQDTGDTNSNYIFTNTAAMAAATTYTIRIYEMAGLEPAEGDDEVGVGVIGPDAQAVTLSAGDIEDIATAVAAELGTGALVNVTPISFTLTTGEVTDTALTIYQYSAQTYLFACVDSQNTALNLSGKTVKMSAYLPWAPATEIFNVTGSVGGASNNQVTIIVPATATGTARTYEYRLWNTTDDVVIGSGTLEVKANPDRT